MLMRMTPTSLDERTVIVRWLALAEVPPGALATWLGLLDTAERSRAERFRFERDRLAYVAAHALARSLLATLCAIPPDALRFAAGPHGKPNLVAEQNGRGLRFNISHCAGMVVVAVATGAEIGIDVESVDRDWTMDLAESFLAPAELAAMRELAEAARAQALASTWTLKEAFVKAIGAGLSHPLDRIIVRAEPLSLCGAARDAAEPDGWSFRHYRPDGRHVVALAVKRAAVAIDAGPADVASIAPAGAGIGGR